MSRVEGWTYKVAGAAFAISTALGGHPDSHTVYAQSVAGSAACTTFSGEIVPIRETDSHSKMTCLGVLTTPLGSLVSIFRNLGSARSDKHLVVIEQDMQGTQRSRSIISLTYPNYALPDTLTFLDYAGNKFSCSLDPILSVYGNCALVEQVQGPEPTSTLYPTRTPTAPPTAIPTSTLPPHAEVPSIAPPESFIPGSQPEPNYEASTPAMCYDSWGTRVKLGEKRAGTDDCIAVNPDTPERGSTTYTYQTEPGPDGKTAIIEVVRQSNGKIYFNIPPRQARTAVRRSSFQSLLEGMQALLPFFRHSDARVVAQTQQQSSQDSTPSSAVSYPSKDQLPKGVLSQKVISWYDTVQTIAVTLNYDPRTHLVFIQIESKGNPKALSPAGAMGLVQIMPGTWDDIKNTIIMQSWLLNAAKQAGVDPYTANPWKPKDNIFFSAVYLIAYCRLPEGAIPVNDVQGYTEMVAWAAKRYHDGPASHGISPKGQEYMAGIRNLLPRLAGQ
ncbi:hypothetical protein A3D08_03525 [Candidatus Roizmanbacteria bacterium RIFCSPHIGHO2_02_FULL_43_11]|uniref:Transglycosylase SLT domain-containing protein n=1 Tax=Candidatus Roizmanbacteria bacterium RIFCSPHIGHO2_02_FULL_43_11 TaxID=1802043 RepID=A0A1F7HJB3_9BACT|nr:MAG: hypothetical protein A3D08_03525 [Candidatus Roizmanbacteria bacterium RIFCSPHIGHO2_02_FULL_43_11]